MRLICPNCDATYEVPDSVIPPEGRDVQCSNCGTTWFFDPNPQVEAETLPPEPEVEAEPEPELPPEEVTDLEIEEFDAADATELEEVSAVEAEPPAPPPLDEPRRRALDGKVAEVLRAEAAYEARARAADADLEYQDDLPLETPPTAPPPRFDDEAAAAAATGSRRDLLPDIDEINSTLRSTSERKAAEVSPASIDVIDRGRRRGFRIGFGLACFVLALGALIYSYAGDIAMRVPVLEGTLVSYVETINGGRAWLEDAVARLAARLNT